MEAGRYGKSSSGYAEVFLRGTWSVCVSCAQVFQRRKDGSVNFFRGWKEYVRGFGDLSGEFWLGEALNQADEDSSVNTNRKSCLSAVASGLDSLHNLTTMTKMSLRVDLRDKDESAFAKYSTFEVAKKSYKLTVGGYSGNAGERKQPVCEFVIGGKHWRKPATSSSPFR